MMTEVREKLTIDTTYGEAELLYELTAEPSRQQEGSNLYGIRITFRTEHEAYDETSGALSYSKEDVLCLLHKLVLHTVTPTGMIESIDELILE